MGTNATVTVEPRWDSAGQPDLLTLVANVPGVVGRDANELFLAACKADAERHGGYVSVNRVRGLLASWRADIPPRRYSAMWFANTGIGKPMVRLRKWEVCAGSTSGNDGRPFALRLWLDPNGVDLSSGGPV